MTRSSLIAVTCLVAWVATASQANAQAGAAAAVKASPDLVNALSKELGGSPEQAAGAAGSLFGIAKSRLSAADFSKVASAVPGMDSLLAAAPAAEPAKSSANPIGTAGGALAQLGGSAAGLASAATAFSKLGLKPELVAKAVPVLTSFVTKSGGADVGNLLAGVLK